MTEYETPDGRTFAGAEVFGRLKSGSWDLVAESDDPETVVVRDEDGDLLELELVPGSEEQVEPDRPFAA